jgi:hypothetical protein
MSSIDIGSAPKALGQAEGEAPPLGRLRRLTGAVFSPGKTFLDISRNPDWVLPVVFSVLVVVCGNLLVSMLYKRNPEAVARQSVEKRLAEQGISITGMPEKQRQEVELQIRVLSKMLQITPILSGIYLPLMMAVLGLVFWLGVRLIRGGSTYKKVFAVTAYAYGAVYIGVQTIVQIIVATLRHPEVLGMPKGIVVTNAGSLLSSDASPVLAEFLKHFDLFTFWFLILMSIGLAAVCKSRRLTRTAPLVFALWGLWVAVRVVWIAVIGS